MYIYMCVCVCVCVLNIHTRPLQTGSPTLCIPWSCFVSRVPCSPACIRVRCGCVDALVWLRLCVS